MVTELLLPRGKILRPKPPSRIKLDMAFGVGVGASLFDKSRYRSHGAITTATWAAGVHGYCLDFVAANPDFVEIPAAHTQLDFTTQDFSFIVRLKADDLTANVAIYYKGTHQVDGIFWLILSTGALDLYTNQLLARQRSFSSGGDIVVGNWYTVGISRDGASVKLFKNGVDVTFSAGAHINPTTCARSAKIGIRDNRINDPFDGKIEFLRIFGGIALTASEHLAYHNALR